MRKALLSEETFDPEEDDALSLMAQTTTPKAEEGTDLAIRARLRIRGEYDPPLSESDVEGPPLPPATTPPTVRMAPPNPPLRWQYIWDPWAGVYVRHPAPAVTQNLPVYETTDSNGNIVISNTMPKAVPPKASEALPEAILRARATKAKANPPRERTAPEGTSKC